MRRSSKTSWLALALLATTMLTPPEAAQAAPGDAIGPEFQVNSFTTGQQWGPSVAMGADGDFVVAWTNGYYLYGDVFAQLFDARGVAQSPEFRVNTFTTGSQWSPAVAMDADGDFVVAWTGEDGDNWGVFAQLFEATGVARGSEFQVNTVTTGSQLGPAVAMDADGDFVVVWSGLNEQVYAQRYDAAGLAQGGEFQVNSRSIFMGNTRRTVAMDADGDFIVAWDGLEYYDGRGYVGYYYAVKAQRYDAAGVARGLEFQVNSFATKGARFPAVAMDADGEFVVTWVGSDDSNQGLLARRYDAAGVAQGSEFQVNSFTTGAQRDPAMAMDADGDFVVAWVGRGPGDTLGVFAQLFDAAGVAQGPEFRVNSFTMYEQWSPAVTMDADGDFVVVWDSVGQDDPSDTSYMSGKGVFAQRYDGAARVAGDFDGDGNADLLWRNAASGKATIWLMEGTEKRASKTIGTVPLVWRIAGTGDFNGDGRADILWRNTKSGAALVWQMNGFTREAVVRIGAPKPAWVVEKVEDTNGDGNADIFWRNENTNESIVWQMLGTKKVATDKTGKVKPVWQVQ